MRVSARHFLTRTSLPALAVAALSLALIPSFSNAQGLLGVLHQDNTNTGAKTKPNMVVKARELQYDQDNDTVTAIGGVQIYYGERTLQADRVVYDRKLHRVRASGNVVITEADGTVTHANNFDLTDDYKEGFINSLKILTPDETRLASNRAERAAGDVTTFQNGVYTACLPCQQHPEKPPWWQIKAVKIIHNEQEKMIYFEDAWFELFGYPVAYSPYMSTPDPSVKRKTGFITPTYYNASGIGYGVDAPYFIDLAPNYDMTITPGFTTTQGPNGEVEWRHRLESGRYSITASGTFQAQPDKFADENIGSPRFRGSIQSQGEFWLNDKWRWGWNGSLLTDRFYWRDYKLTNLKTLGEADSTIYLTGSGDKSWFDARAYYFQTLQQGVSQKQLPIALPVVDYDYIVDHPVFGGELGWNSNFTNITRQDAAFTNILNGVSATCDGSTLTTRANCVQTGVGGNYSRASLNVYWKKTLTDTYGEQWTPFTYVRGDLGYTSLNNSDAVQFVKNGFAANVVPAIGLDYRYPLIWQADWGNQVIEPIAQVILRPKAAQTGQFPNEDAQSLIFDDSNLFQWDKFSGWDRLEDGSRVNAGFQYTLTTKGGGVYNAMFGQSAALFGYNPYKNGDMTNTGLESGLDTIKSDYVGRIALQPYRDFALFTDARFNDSDWAMRQVEAGATGTVGQYKADLTYGRYGAQPELGLGTRTGLNGKTSIKITDNWIASAGALYDLNEKRFAQSSLGLSYVNECVSFGLIFQRNFNTTTLKQDTSVQVQFAFRGLGTSGTKEQFVDRTWTNAYNDANPY